MNCNAVWLERQDFDPIAYCSVRTCRVPKQELDTRAFEETL